MEPLELIGAFFERLLSWRFYVCVAVAVGSYLLLAPLVPAGYARTALGVGIAVIALLVDWEWQARADAA